MKVLLQFVCLAALVALSFADCPYGLIAHGSSASDRDEVVNSHNSWRQAIANGEYDQPKGVNLKRMKWNETLAEKAQEWADQCKFEHNNVEGTPWDWVGQNLAIRMSSAQDNKGAEYSTAVKMWFDEVYDYSYPDDSSSATGHYTQVVWADSEYVGCGFAYYLDEDDWYTKLYVCNYGPGGNWVGQAPYKLDGPIQCPNLCD